MSAKFGWEKAGNSWEAMKGNSFEVGNACVFKLNWWLQSAKCAMILSWILVPFCVSKQKT